MSDLIINPFDNAGYDLATMTKAVNIIPNAYGRVRDLGLFKREPVRTRTVIVEELNGRLTLLKTQPNGAPAPKAKHGKGKIRSFVVPHIPFEDQIFPDDIQGVREGGTASDTKTLVTEMTKRLTTMRGSHAITEEFHLVGALKGIVLDADGDVLYNWFDEFGITQKVLTFALANDGTDVTSKCREVLRHIEDNLMGEVMSGVRCLCGQNYFDALIAHPNVEKFYVGHAEALNLTGSGVDPRKGFNFGGITFEEYRAKATDPETGTLREFIGDDDSHFFPEGTQDTFKVHDAPANYMETVNTYGVPIYAKQTADPKGKHVDINTEANPLTICRRPGVLVKGLLN